MNDEQRRRMLLEDLGTDVNDLLPIIEQLGKWQAPQPSHQQTASLIDLLSAKLPAQQLSRWQRLREWWPLLLIRSQMRVVQREIWIASALVMILGTLVTLAMNTMMINALAIIAPLVAAFGVALLYDSNTEHVLELENATGASVQVLLLARLTLVFGFDLVMGILGSVILATTQTHISLWPLVLSWLAPMAFLSALAFLLSVLVVDAIIGAVVSLGLWALHIFLRSTPADHTLMIAILSMPGLNTPGNYGLLFAAALLLTTVALWVVGSVERSVGA
ncbi:MAG: hypothetical protein K8L99_01065 [Anaerolineae bacterium]|nr:hypothetical protein [Anaerolineae bacterium]